MERLPLDGNLDLTGRRVAEVDVARRLDERLADAWPADGPKVAWKKPVGSGYSGVAVAAGRAYLFHRQGAKEVLEALDAATGETLWSEASATTFRPQVGGGDGPLCVPVVHGGVVITYGAQGVLTARDAATGNSWSGRGLRPNWLKAALASGRKLEDFAV